MRKLNPSICWPMMLAMTIIVTPAAFANACTKLDKAACERQATCTWVAPYKRMDGVKVSGFCRNKQKRNAEPSLDQGH